MKTKYKVLEQIHLGRGSAREIAEALNISAPVVSRIAQKLISEALITKEGRIYRPRPAALQDNERSNQAPHANADPDQVLSLATSHHEIIMNGLVSVETHDNGNDSEGAHANEECALTSSLASRQSEISMDKRVSIDADANGTSSDAAHANENPAPLSSLASPRREISMDGLISILTAARHYRDELGWVVHPLHGPNAGIEKERGKKPLLKGWKNLTLADTDDAYLQKHFGGRAPANVGVVVKPPHIVIDLDSKATGGEAVYRWLGDQPELSRWPRERTAGGCHLHIYCEDVPAEAIEAAGRSQKLTATVAEGVTAELFLGGNVVVAPSVHKSGHRYEWEVAGKLPQVPWARIEKVFFASTPVETTARKKARAASPQQRLGARFEGDLRTLDIVALCKELGIYGQPLSGEENKHTVRCPWHDQHSDAGSPWSPSDSSTVIWEAPDKGFPNFFCSHISHGTKGFADLLDWAQKQRPGIVDKHCHQKRVWDANGSGIMPPKTKGRRARPRILLPCTGRLDSDFAKEMGAVLQSQRTVFSKGPLPVEIQMMKDPDAPEKGSKTAESSAAESTEESAPTRQFSDEVALSFVRPARAITLFENFVEPGVLVSTKNPLTGETEKEFVPKSMSANQAGTLLLSDGLLHNLPPLKRILTYPAPLIDPRTNLLTCPLKGYDPRFQTYLVPDSPDIYQMTLGEAKAVIDFLLKDFCLKGQQDVVHNIAFWLSPLCQGLLDRWSSRTPLWLLLANRPRAGKDYDAAVMMLIYFGRIMEDPPVGSDGEEFRKKLTAAMMRGRLHMHMSNCAGRIQNPMLEQAVTNEGWNDRILGANEMATIPNEMSFSMSGNVGMRYTPDLAARMRVINLHYSEEHENLRKFRTPDLHGWVLKNRSKVLSALWTFVRHWDTCGRPDGPTPFTSFPSWARVVGGIMHACELGDPCLPDSSALGIGGDDETGHMKRVYQIAHEQIPEKWVTRKQLRELVVEANEEGDAGLFNWLDLSTQSGAVRFGTIVERYVGRIFDDVKLEKDGTVKKVTQQRIRFIKPRDAAPVIDPVAMVLKMDRSQNPLFAPQTDGRVGSVGSLFQPPLREENQKMNYESIRTEEKKTQNIKTRIGNGAEKTAKYANPPMGESPRLITDPEEFGDIAGTIALADCPVALDIETYGNGAKDALDRYKGHIRLLTLAVPGQAPWLIDLRATGYDLGAIGAILESGEIIVHNARFDLGFLRHHCGLRCERVFCTMTASRLLTAGSGGGNDLGAVLRRHCIADLPKEHGKSDWGGLLMDDMLCYAAGDVVHLHALRGELEAAIHAAALMPVLDLELELLPLVVDMEATGVGIDRTQLEGIRDEAKAKAEAAEARVRASFGNEQLNVGSPAQLVEALRRLGVPVASTAEKVLAELEHPVAAQILEARAAAGVVKQAETLLGVIRADGRIHGQFDPTGTKAGRFSSKDPNLQNIGRGALRGCFVAPEGRLLVCADYSQIELRVAAALAGEERMIEAYRSGADLHRRTAALVLGKEENAITKDDRQTGKAVSFGLLFGQGAKGLVVYAKTAYGVTLKLTEAEEIRKRFFRAYSGLGDYQRRVGNEIRRGQLKETRTRLGRRRFLPTGDDPQQSPFTCALNSPIQGGAADGLKRALLRLRKELPAGASIISTVHDEIIVECAQADAGTVARSMESAMIGAMAELYPEVPIEVEARSGRSWAEAK